MWRTSGFSAAVSVGGSVRGGAGGYGYGLGVSRDCKFSRVVSHGGGLPGFGSFMMWLPEYGVGMFAMANLTYSGPSAPMRQALDLMAGTGALKPRELPVSPVLLQTQKALSGLWDQWSDSGMDAIAADNLYLDLPRELRRKQVAELKNQFTECRPEGALRPENWLRGTFSLGCKEGRVDVTFTLAPTQPPKVQMVRFEGVKNPNAALREAAELQAKATPYGQCSLGDVLSSDGKETVVYRLRCGNGEATMNLLRGKASFGVAPGQSCT
ncbi:MAG: serine hydrolase, partial [Bryobacteraceae bacterium]|nr:serine hydrolase [Bryobacteraceae bacterium]